MRLYQLLINFLNQFRLWEQYEKIYFHRCSNNKRVYKYNRLRRSNLRFLSQIYFLQLQKIDLYFIRSVLFWRKELFLFLNFEFWVSINFKHRSHEHSDAQHNLEHAHGVGDYKENLGSYIMKWRKKCRSCYAKKPVKFPRPKIIFK